MLMIPVGMKSQAFIPELDEPPAAGFCALEDDADIWLTKAPKSYVAAAASFWTALVAAAEGCWGRYGSVDVPEATFGDVEEDDWRAAVG